MNREVLDTWCARGILGLVLAILVFGPLAMGAVETPYFLVIEGLTLAAMVLWGIRLWVSPQPQLLWTPVCWTVLAFSAYAIVRYRTADLEYVARLEMVRVLIYTFLFLTILNNLHRQEHTQIITLTLIFLAMGISFYAVFQFVTGSDKVWNLITPYPHRGTGTYVSPNHLAGFLEMILPLALAALLVSRAKPVVKILAGYASLVILAGIAVSVSRGGWVSTVLALAIFFGLLISNRSHRIPSIVLLAVLLGGALYFIPRTHFLQARLKEINANNKFNDSARFELWEPAWRLWRENIWWGIGPGHYNYRFRQYRPQVEQLQPDRVHNDYLNTLTDWGVAGVAIVSSAWILLFVGVSKAWKFVRAKSGDLGGGNSNKFALVLGTSLGLLAILFHSFVDFNMHIPANAILAVSLMALLSGASRFATDRYWVKVRVATGAILTLAILAGASYLGWQGNRSLKEYVWIRKASQAKSDPSAQVAALEQAFAAEPKNFETAYRIGEILRAQSWQGNDDYAQLAARAMEWYKRSMELDPYDGYGYLHFGTCLDWIGKSKEAKSYFDQAVKLDPNGYYTADWVGWHYVQTGDYAAARMWFERSRHLEWNSNTIADSYLPLVTKRMLAEAEKSKTDRIGAPLTK